MLKQGPGVAKETYKLRQPLPASNTRPDYLGMMKQLNEIKEKCDNFESSFQVIKDIKMNQELLRQQQSQIPPYPYEEMLRLRKLNQDLQMQNENAHIKYNRDMESRREKIKQQEILI